MVIGESQLTQKFSDVEMQGFRKVKGCAKSVQVVQTSCAHLLGEVIQRSV